MSVRCQTLGGCPSPVSLCCFPLLFLILPALCLDSFFHVVSAKGNTRCALVRVISSTWSPCHTPECLFSDSLFLTLFLLICAPSSSMWTSSGQYPTGTSCDIGSCVGARHTIHVSCGCVSDLSSTLSSHSSFVSPMFYFILLIFHFIVYVGRSERNSLCASADEESDSFVNNAPLTGNEPKFFDDYHFSETSAISPRSPPATPGPRTCMTRKIMTTPSQSALFTTLVTLLEKVCCGVECSISR